MSKAGKHSAYTQTLSDSLGRLFNRSMRAALLAGLARAVLKTEHDSSNAGYHWLLAANKSRPGSRTEGKLRDLRGTATPPVGNYEDGGANAGKTLTFVKSRETLKVLDKYLTGRRPETSFYLYNAVGGDETYAGNADIDTAGTEGVNAVAAEFQRQLVKGNARKVPL